MEVGGWGHTLAGMRRNCFSLFLFRVARPLTPASAPGTSPGWHAAALLPLTSNPSVPSPAGLCAMQLLSLHLMRRMGEGEGVPKIESRARGYDRMSLRFSRSLATGTNFTRQRKPTRNFQASLTYVRAELSPLGSLNL